VSGRDQADRRRYRRRTVRVLVEYLSDAGLCCDTATTLGAGGLFIETDQPLPEGTAIKLAFRLPDSDVRHEIEGTVAWAHRPSGGSVGAAGMGVEFSDRVASARLARELQRLAA
jgi:type IV pilus assembly protein PilZ